MNISKSILAAGILALMATTPALADPKPKNSTPADPKVIHKIYNGNTWEWRTGASYWGKKGVFQATWKGESYADGKWYVTNKGTLCYDAVWTFKDDGVVQTEQLENCWQHVVDADGQLWKRSHEKEDWHKPDFKDVKRGNQLKAEHKKIKKTVGS